MQKTTTIVSRYKILNFSSLYSFEPRTRRLKNTRPNKNYFIAKKAFLRAWKREKNYERLNLAGFWCNLNCENFFGSLEGASEVCLFRPEVAVNCEPVRTEKRKLIFG